MPLHGHALKTFVEHPVPLRRVNVDEFVGAAFIVDPDGFIATWNDAAAAPFGRQAEDAIGKHCSQVVRACSVDGRSMCGAHCPFLHQTSRHETIDEVDIGAGSGERIRAFLHHAPLEDAFGRNAGVLHTVTPVPEPEPAVRAA